MPSLLRAEWEKARNKPGLFFGHNSNLNQKHRENAPWEKFANIFFKYVYKNGEEEAAKRPEGGNILQAGCRPATALANTGNRDAVKFKQINHVCIKIYLQSHFPFFFHTVRSTLFCKVADAFLRKGNFASKSTLAWSFCKVCKLPPLNPSITNSFTPFKLRLHGSPSKKTDYLPHARGEMDLRREGRRETAAPRVQIAMEGK